MHLANEYLPPSTICSSGWAVLAARNAFWKAAAVTGARVASPPVREDFNRRVGRSDVCDTRNSVNNRPNREAALILKAAMILNFSNSHPSSDSRLGSKTTDAPNA